MRPQRLELHGFASYRDATVVDFDGCELFVLTGPTGSGKSSIIDGMTFALYGAVPRYEDVRLVAPIISKGREEARVRLDFAVGEDQYTAVRVVRRTSSGATTKEARLERNGEVVAGDAREMNETVAEVLGLEFDQFQKCVVLPQGEFAQFLHDRTKDRQSLLTKLLGIEYLGEVRTRAHLRYAQAEEAVRSIEAQLEGPLAHATEVALEALRRRIATLEKVLSEVERDAKRVDELDQEAREARKAAEEAGSAVTALRAIVVPGGVDRLTEALADAEDALKQAAARTDEAEDALAGRRATLEGLPSKADLQAVVRARGELGRVEGLLAKAVDERDRAIAEATAKEEAFAQAEGELGEAERRREAILNENYAYRLASGLQAGDVCPVCGETLDAVPAHDAPPGHAEATAERDAARTRRDDAERASKAAATARVQAEERVRGLEEQQRALQEELAGKPGADEAHEQLGQIAEAEKACQEAEEVFAAARKAMTEAGRGVEAARLEADGGWSRFVEARDTVAGYRPPPFERTSLVAAWDALATWAGEEATGRRAGADEATTRASACESERDALRRVMRERCAEAEVAAGAEDPVRAVHGELERSRERRGQLERDIERAAELRQQRDEQRELATVADALHTHLRVDRFEKWYVRRVVHQLAAGASARLKELSRGQFSLGLSDREEFEVVDHANADERRFIRTLSGGETFLASLALALALSEILGGVAKERPGRLEAIFLDEGFGTLDAETLDVVATAIEELAAGGRMVGLVTHVPELAARMPVRYEVSKGPRGSRVTRVES